MEQDAIEKVLLAHEFTAVREDGGYMRYRCKCGAIEVDRFFSGDARRKHVAAMLKELFDKAVSLICAAKDVGVGG